MTRASCSRRRAVFLVIALGALAGTLYWVVAAPPLLPRQEEMTLDGVRVVVDYTTSVSAEDLMLPFHPGAELEHGFSYAVKTKDGKDVSYYALAVLTIADPPKTVAEAYRDQLPGRPQPELIEDESGTRYVLAIGTDEEVRRVTITGHDDGSQIELIRATRPATPSAPRRPRRPRSPGERVA